MATHVDGPVCLASISNGLKKEKYPTQRKEYHYNATKYPGIAYDTGAFFTLLGYFRVDATLYIL